MSELPRNKKPKVAIIDSGAGGLSIARALVSRSLDLDLVYVADKAFFPYGVLDDKLLLERLIYIVEKLHNIEEPDIVIIACNTASTLALKELRSRWDTPFIGVVPAVKPAALHSKSKEIAVIATKATVERDYLSKLIREFAKETKVKVLASQRLVDIAERFIYDTNLDLPELHTELDNLLAGLQNIDTVVLACTHFPILKAQIEEHLKTVRVNVVDSTEAIVNRLCSLCAGLELNKKQFKNNYSANFYSTNEERLTHYGDYIFGKEHKPNSNYYQDF